MEKKMYDFKKIGTNEIEIFWIFCSYLNVEGVTDEKLLENERLFDIFSALCVCGP